MRKSETVLGCDPSLLYDVLTDYDGYAEWLPQVAQSKALAREGDLAIAEFDLSQPSKERFVIECIHTRNKMVLWRAIGGNIPIYEVEWTISPSGESQTKVTLAITTRTNWNSLLPKYRRFLDPPKCLKALERQISTFAPEMAVTDEEGERILELAETEEGVVCWIRGKKYVLKPETGGNHD